MKSATVVSAGTDLHIQQGDMDSRVKIPQIIGHEMSGVVAEIGKGTTRFSVGDLVVVRPLDSCGICDACHAGYSHICENLNFMGIDSPGALQGSWTVPEKTLHKLPPGTELLNAALVEPLAVACHDVRLAEVKSADRVVVIGGGPIGMLISLVARFKGAKVLLSEINPFRLSVAEELGFTTVNPHEQDLSEQVKSWTGGTGADVVFEVSGSPDGIGLATELCRARGRIILVAIYSRPERVDLFKFFWQELRMIGVRVYEAQDFDESIQLVAAQALPLNNLITSVRPLTETAELFETLTTTTDQLKILVDCT